jgi:putative ABC transport system substrate-binding protein
MRRRDLLELIVGTVLASPSVASAQTGAPVPRIGYVFSFVPAEGRHLWEACREGLRELGYVEGSSIRLEPRWAEGRHERLPALVAELVQLNVDAIVAAATPAARAAKAATATIPIVIVAVGEPVKSGLVASLARPGGNITGLSLLTPELSGKRLELLKEVLPRLARVAVLMNPDNPVSAVFLEETRHAAGSLRLELKTVEARNAGETEQAFARLASLRTEALIVFDDPVIWSYRSSIVALAAERRLPAMYGYRDFVDAGGLMSYGPSRPDQYRRTAGYIDRILKGAKPADLPIEQPTRFDLIVNQRTAKALGLELPTSVLLRASEIIE